MRKKNYNRWTRTQRKYEIVDHLCRHCLGRLILDRVNSVVKCARCGTESRQGKIHTTLDIPKEKAGAKGFKPMLDAGALVESLCMCGVRAGKFDRLFVCVKNPDKSKTSPNEIVVMEVPGQTATPSQKDATSRKANIPPIIFKVV